MERVLLGVYETEKAIVRIYTGSMTATEEQRRELLTRASERLYSRNSKVIDDYMDKIGGTHHEN